MYCVVKRILDILFSILLLAVLSPVILIIIIAVKIDSKGPIIFKQKRIGIHKSEFYMFKFRTMYTDTKRRTHTPSENPEKWITKVGMFLRKTSLDELPQLINILKGDMSFIGPRPAWNQYDLIEERENMAPIMSRSSLTGWAQVNGRDELPIAKLNWMANILKN